MRVSGYGIDLTAHALEILVFVRKVFQLRRADECEIRGVEEKYAPFAENILLGYRLEIVLVKRVRLEICNFFSNH
jgi:hypothetical protein